MVTKQLKLKYICLIAGFILLTVIGYWLLPKEEIVVKETLPMEDEYIYVHITGEINQPGLTKVKYGTRLYELIEVAGGETENADLSRINLAGILSDEQKVVIPSKVVVTEETEEMGGLVNINTASKEKLMKLSGVGEGTAEKIIKYRQENGYFNTIEDLMKVSGIGQSKFNGLKDDITT